MFFFEYFIRSLFLTFFPTLVCYWSIVLVDKTNTILVNSIVRCIIISAIAQYIETEPLKYELKYSSMAHFCYTRNAGTISEKVIARLKSNYSSI